MWIIRLTKKRKKSLDMLPQKEAFHKKDIQRRPPDVGLNVLLQQEDMSATLQRSLFSVNRVFHLSMGSNATAKLRCVQTTHWFFWASRSQVLHPRFSTNEEGGIRRSTVKVISWIKSRQYGNHIASLWTAIRGLLITFSLSRGSGDCAQSNKCLVVAHILRTV